MYESNMRTRREVKYEDLIESVERFKERLLEVVMDMVELNI
jgi:hypothetical protein